MAQAETTRPEARTETTLVVEETSSLVGFQAIAKAMDKAHTTNNKATAEALGEDSATPFMLTGVLTVGEETALIDESGHIIVERSFTRPQTSAFKTTNAIRDALAVMGMHAPKMAEAIMASMLASKDGGDSAAALEANGFNISDAALERANAFMASLASKSTRTVSAAVKVSLD